MEMGYNKDNEDIKFKIQSHLALQQIIIKHYNFQHKK